MFLNSNALDADLERRQTVSDGSRTKIGKGEALTFNSLPNQPVAIVTYNNTGNTTPFNVVYNNQAPKQFEVASVQGQGFSLGLSYLINPANTGANEISVSVPNTAQDDASLDVYAVSLFLPLSGIQNQEIPLNGKQVRFNGYSRAYATPPLAWYQLSLQSQETGLVGFKFIGDSVEVMSVNVAKEAEPALKSKVYFDKQGTGISPENVSFTTKTGNSINENFYGISSQIVYSPVSSANTTNNGTIAIQKL